MWRVDSLKKTLMLEGIEGRRRRGWPRMRWLYGNTDSMDVSLSELWEMVTWRPGVLRFMGSQTVGHNWVTELNWTEDIKDNSKLFKAVRLTPVASEAVTALFWSLQEMLRAQHHHVIFCITKWYRRKKKLNKVFGLVFFVFIIGGWQFNLLLCNNPVAQ